MGTRPQLGATAQVSNDLFLAKYLDAGPAATVGWTQAGGNGDAEGLGCAVVGTRLYVAGYAVPPTAFGHLVLPAATSIAYITYLLAAVDLAGVLTHQHRYRRPHPGRVP